ncbi:DJ-1/PfpI family protein [Caulobacter sp. 17J65-9]|uniref:DJ-1/PfpI family protein n=1 Tax=Caulobacter sp. 17J65-9 TaxID=2709382 RepID=UPI001969F11C
MTPETAPPRRVAVLMFDDVEVLDFAGPFEVFGVARGPDETFAFEVFTVALEAGPVVARNGLCVNPHACAADIGRVDVLVVPGGRGTRREMGRPDMLEFVRAASAQAQLTLSVCTGALILGAAGLLRGLAATTHYAALNELRALDCARVLPRARVVDNGRILTATGVSAGIDGALHVVARTLGEAHAAETARYMQYDWRRRRVARWSPPG